MRLLIAALLTIGSLFGQTDDDDEIRSSVTSSLMSLHSQDRAALQEATEELIARILAVPEAGHQPRSPALAMFARRLAAAVAGRDLKRPSASRIAAGVTGALRSAVMGTATFNEHVSGFHRSLSDIGVKAFSARSLAEDLRALGQEVRGPQDLPLLPLR